MPALKEHRVNYIPTLREYALRPDVPSAFTVGSQYCRTQVAPLHRGLQPRTTSFWSWPCFGGAIFPQANKSWVCVDQPRCEGAVRCRRAKPLGRRPPEWRHSQKKRTMLKNANITPECVMRGSRLRTAASFSTSLT